MLDQKSGLAAGDKARLARRVIESADMELAPLRIVRVAGAGEHPSSLDAC